MPKRKRTIILEKILEANMSKAKKTTGKQRESTVPIQKKVPTMPVVKQPKAPPKAKKK